MFEKGCDFREKFVQNGRKKNFYQQRFAGTKGEK